MAFHFTKDRVRATLRGLLSPLLIVGAALGIAGIMVLCIGKNPLTVYASLFQGAFGSLSALINTINKSIPICFCAFAVSISQKGGTFNIGVEGQLVMGAAGCTIAGIYLQGLPPYLHIPLAMGCGVLAGFLWSLIPALLFIKRGVSLLVIFLLMNSIAAFLLQYFVLDLFASQNALVPCTEAVLESARLPCLITRPNRLSIAFLFVLLCAGVLHVFYTRTTTGYELRATGLGREAARTAGIPVKRYMFLSLVLGGVLAGLGGSLEILGNHHRLYTSFSPGYGYDGIPIALLSGGNPFAAILGSLLFGALRAGSINMRAMSGVSDEIVSIIQGLLILFVGCQYIVRYLLNRGNRKKEGTK